MSERERLKRKCMLEDFAAVLSTEAGRRVIGSILFMGHRYTSTLDVMSPTMTAYNEGMRAMGIVVANTVREINPYMVTSCEVLYEAFLDRFAEEDVYGDDGE